METQKVEELHHALLNLILIQMAIYENVFHRMKKKRKADLPIVAELSEMADFVYNFNETLYKQLLWHI